MSTTITWSVKQMISLPAPGVDKFVLSVSCDITATDGKSTASTMQGAKFEYEPGTKYAPYEDLKEDQVISWVKDSIGQESVAGIENSLTQTVYVRSNPPVAPSAAPLPWANS